MDREYLRRRYYEELERASQADSDIARQAHEALAQAFKDAAAELEPPTVVQIHSGSTRAA